MHNPIYELLSQDPKLRPFIEKVGLEFEPIFKEQNLHTELISSIVSQQLSVKAAATIYQRFLSLFNEGILSLTALQNMSIEQLRAVGLSNQKANYVLNAATFFQDEHNQELDWNSMSDDEIITRLTSIKGVGKWTVEMLLIFYMERTDILPMDDLIVRKGLLKVLDLPDEKKSNALIIAHAEQWRPYRSYVSRLMWKIKPML